MQHSNALLVSAPAGSASDEFDRLRRVAWRFFLPIALVGILVAPLGATPGHATGLDTLPTNTCLAPDRPSMGGLVPVTLDPVVSNLGFSQALGMVQHSVDSDVRYVIWRGGRVHRFFGCCSSSVALNITSQVFSSSEGGLLGIALHPNFATNSELFLSYTTPGTGGQIDSVVSKFTSVDGGLTFPPASEVEIIRFTQPTTIHNGGDLAFGPDGFLYMSFGDGGVSANAQDTSNVLGAILRVDVDSGSPYAIPPSNPFAGGGGAPEIWAWGLRNPYRFGFDPDLGDLWAGDVGQALQEEVDIVREGENYGWPIREGSLCFSGDCQTPGLTEPEFTYPHTQGCAIVGGRVYRGDDVPELDGAYIYGDYCARQVWAAIPDGGSGYLTTPLASVPGFLGGFSQDSDGEVLIISGNQVFRLAPDTSTPTPFPQKLTETGCVDLADPSKPAPGTIPYSVNEKLWSDGADKTRWMGIPAGEQIAVAASDGDFDLPIGSVTVKTFLLNENPVETRLFVRHDDGGWAGYTYEWDPDGLDATLLADSKTKMIEGQEWTYPSRAQCLQCHGIAPGYTLGLETLQLNGPHFYESTGRTANQLETLDHLGLLSPPLSEEPGQLPAMRGETLDERARGYLHANCSNCHRPSGGAGVNVNLMFDAALPYACDFDPVAGNLGVPGAKVLKPGDPALSIISLRMHLLGADQMPPLARAIVDQDGTQLIDAWISSHLSCALGPDSDADGVADADDSCINAPNPDQTDTDSDGFGNSCDCDFNQDLTCNISDFNVFFPDFLNATDAGTGTDMNDDGTVNISDFNVFLQGFLATLPGPSGIVP